MMQILPTGSKNGFTLLELIVAMSIGAMMLTCVYFVFHTSLKAHNRASQAMDALQWARYAFSRFTEDVRNIRHDDKQAPGCVGNECVLPVYDKIIGQAWVQYVREQEGTLVRKVVHADRQKPDFSASDAFITIIGEQVKKVTFGSETGSKSRVGKPTLLSMALDMGSTPDKTKHFEKKVVVEY